MQKKPDIFDTNQSLQEYASQLSDYYTQFDYLSKAASELKQSIFAKRNGDYNKAWVGFNKVKELYLKHAEHNKFTAKQTLALEACVSEHLADIHRLEGRNEDALLHIAYWVANSEQPTKKQMQKLQSYFRRCKFKDIEYIDLVNLINSLPEINNFSLIKAAIKSWI